MQPDEEYYSESWTSPNAGRIFIPSILEIPGARGTKTALSLARSPKAFMRTNNPIYLRTSFIKKVLLQYSRLVR